MSSNERTTEVVHDLLLIQQKRIHAYEKALKYCVHDDVSVCALLRDIITQSRQCVNQLRSHTAVDLGEPADRSETKGEIYRQWPKIDFFAPGHTNHEIIHCCGFIEKTTLDTYKKVLEKERFVDNNLRQLISTQRRMTEETFLSVQAYMGKPSAPEISKEERMPCSFLREHAFAEV